MHVPLPVTALLVQPGEPPMHLAAIAARHRFLAAVIAGHADVLATLEPSTQETP